MSGETKHDAALRGSCPPLTPPPPAITNPVAARENNKRFPEETSGEVLAPLLDVRDLHTEFRAGGGIVRAVDGISYAVEPGETVAIVGESGSGKSVGALSILRLIPDPPGRITHAEILFAGRDLMQLSDAHMREVRGGDIGMIFQEPMTSLNPVLT